MITDKVSICQNCFHSYVCEQFNENKDDNNKKCHFANDYYIPRADVVLKSEEGAECPTCYGTGRIGTTDWLTKNVSKKQLAEEKAKAIAKHEQHIKAEVAREIFEEIEKWLVHEYVPYIRGYSNSLSRNFAELKKKYTEGET